jgi:hypothetical protein
MDLGILGPNEMRWHFAMLKVKNGTIGTNNRWRFMKNDEHPNFGNRKVAAKEIEGLSGGGQTVPRTIICRSTIKSYLIGSNSIFYVFNALSDLFRPAVICYFVVGSVVGKGG